MANIFRKKDAYIDRVNRSTFDLSFVNNLTMKFGAITPVCLLPVSFGDSFQIDARFNLQLLPTIFPIQTQLYVRLHFVYVRTRTLWEDWMSFFGGDETVTPPWMDPQTNASTSESHAVFNITDDLQTGSLADYLGIPTTITGSYGQEEEFNPIFCTVSGFSGNVCSVLALDSTDKGQAITFLTSKVGSPSDEAMPCTYSYGADKAKSLSFCFNLGTLPSSSVGKSGKVIVRSIRGLLLGISESWGSPIVVLCDSSSNILKIIECTVSDGLDSISFSLDRSLTDSTVAIAFLVFPAVSISSYGNSKCTNKIYSSRVSKVR